MQDSTGRDRHAGVRSALGTRARQALADKIFQSLVSVDVTERDRYGRLIGRVWLAGRDINRELVQEGHAWVYRRYMTDESLLRDEEAARTSGMGLWSQPDPMPLWNWRRKPSPQPSKLWDTPAFTSGSKRYWLRTANGERSWACGSAPAGRPTRVAEGALQH